MTCVLCERDEPLTAHHLIPRTLHGNKWFKKNFTREERLQTVMICRDCHDAVHRFIDRKELGRFYNTADKLLAHDKLADFVTWIKKGGRP